MTIQLSSPQPTRISSISLFSSRFFLHSVFNACLSVPSMSFPLNISQSFCRLPIYLQRYFFLSHVLFSQIKTSDLLFGVDLCTMDGNDAGLPIIYSTGKQTTFLYLSSSFSVYLFSLARSPPPSLSPKDSLFALYISLHLSISLYLSIYIFFVILSVALVIVCPFSLSACGASVHTFAFLAVCRSLSICDYVSGSNAFFLVIPVSPLLLSLT